MSDTAWVALWTNLPQVITAIGTLLTAVGILVSIIMSYKRGAKIEGKVEEIHKATNSMKDALVAVTRSEALMEGHAAGVAVGVAAGVAAADKLGGPQ